MSQTANQAANQKVNQTVSQTVLKTLSCGLALLSLGLGAAQAADAPEVAATCVACHGERGAAPIMPSYPVIAGQYEDYLAHSLEAYRSGKRKNAIMAGIAGGLSDQDIRELSRYFAQQPSPLYTPKVGR